MSIERSKHSFCTQPKMINRILWLAAAIAVLTAFVACESNSVGSARSIDGYVDSDGTKLHYVIDLPDGDTPFKSVIYGPGSGDTPIGNKILAAHTKELLKLGFAVVRYDKRGVGKSEGELLSLSAENSDFVIARLAADMKAVLEAAKMHPEIDPRRVGLWGVSQASWYMPVVATEVEELEFMVVVTGVLSPVGQQNYWEHLTRVENHDRDSSATTDLARNYEGPTGFDHRPLVRDLDIPVLYLQAESDRFLAIELVREEFDQLKASGANVTFISYEGSGHGLLDVDFKSDMNQWLSLKGLDR